MRINKRLALLRKEKGLSREELSNKLGVSYSTIAKYETGSREPDIEMIDKIALLFDVTTDYLLGRSSQLHLTEDDKRDAIIHKIATEFPDADLMFNDLAGMTADDLQEVYEFIKFKNSQKGKS